MKYIKVKLFFNLWAVGYAENINLVDTKMFEYRSETISNRHQQVDFGAFQWISYSLWNNMFAHRDSEVKQQLLQVWH